MMEAKEKQKAEAQTKAYKELFAAMAKKDNRQTCNDTGINFFKGLNLVDNSEDSLLAFKAQAAFHAATSAAKLHEDPDSEGESYSNHKHKK